MDRIQFVSMFVGVCVGFAIGAADAGAQATETFEVTNTLDTNGTCSDSSCSLREAIKAANASTANTKTITFQDNLIGTIDLSSDLDPITDGVTIDGNAAPNVTV